MTNCRLGRTAGAGPAEPARRRDASDESQENPFAVPGDEQLLALYHFDNKYARPPDDWRLSHTLVNEESRLAAARQQEARKLDHRADLIRELRAKGGPAPFSRMNYVLSMRQLARCRLSVGVKRDGCIRLDHQAELEEAKLLEMKREYKNCVNVMEQFLEEDHEASKHLLRLAEAELARTLELSEHRDELSRRYGSTRLDVYHWEEAWRTVKTCHRFLLRVSDADRPARRESSGSAEVPGPGAGVHLLDYDTSLESLIAWFEKETSEFSKKSDKTPADLGLREVDDLLRIFRTIEQQNLNALINLESLNGPMADMDVKLQTSKTQVKTEIELVLDKIKEVERSIAREEARARRLERESCGLAQRGFRALICSERALRTRILIEDAYEACVGPNETGHDALFMAHRLEGLYEQLSAELDQLPRQLVLQAERDGFRAEMRASHEADEAVRKFELMNRLIASLRRLMEPTPPKYRKLMKRSQPPILHEKKAKAAEIAAALLAQDLLQLDLFGKECNPRKPEEFNDED